MRLDITKEHKITFFSVILRYYEILYIVPLYMRLSLGPFQTVSRRSCTVRPPKTARVVPRLGLDI